MLRIIVRRSNDVRYFTDDPALELDGVRVGGPGWWLRGSGDTSDSASVAAILQTTERSAVFGYDLIFAAPRPLSILLAISPQSASSIVAAHRTSVAAAVEYLEDRAVVIRSRRGGDDVEFPSRWRSIAGFTHGLNRHGEPHLHDHVLVGARADTGDTVIDSRALFAHRTAADSLYRTSLRSEVSRLTSWRPWRSFEGKEHVAGLDEGYRALWGGHHSDRGAKLQWSRDETRHRWQNDLQRLQLEYVPASPKEEHHLDEHVFSGAFEGRITVARRHVVEAWANGATFGVKPGHLTRSVDSLYPELRRGVGVHESVIGVAAARMISLVGERGPRPLNPVELDRWRQRERDRSSSRAERSR